LGRRRRKPKIVERVQLTEIADKGRAFGKKDDMVYFVDGAVPGDIVDVLGTKESNLFVNILSIVAAVNGKIWLMMSN
jgi:tRNA/tmRNA/rRNA uracil-C5-methylase (TrmA/RlmC/RlmD family)